MDNYTLTTSRASRLLGLTLILWAVTKSIAQYVIWHMMWAKTTQQPTDVDSTLGQPDTFFVVASWFEPATFIATGLMLVVFSKLIQKIIR